MFIRVSYVLKTDPNNYQSMTFTGWDRAECHERIRQWELSLGGNLLEWYLISRDC